MPVLGAALLSLFGAIVAFFSTLAVLDGAFLTPWPSSLENRIGAFAAPGLSVAGTANLATLRPIPVTIEPDAGSTRPAAETASIDTSAAARKTAVVAPLVRRTPPTPVLASDETQLVTQPTSIATASTPPPPRIATRKLIAPELRSALGGPRPPPSRQTAPSATPPRPALARTPEPPSQAPSP